MMITLLFCIGDLETVLDTDTGYPFIQLFHDSVGSVAGASVMVAIVLILTWSCAIGITTTASRMTWSFARDRGTPFSKTLSKVDPRTQVPVVAVLAVCGFSALLSLIYIGSPTAFNDVISLTITGFYGSYFLPAAFLLYHRIKGHVASASPVLENPTNREILAAGTEKKGKAELNRREDVKEPASEGIGDPIAVVSSTYTIFPLIPSFT